ncbi:MAG TPA: hypothetical protein VFA18_03290, partial [Gemmataceae bacterium]|nr:hypothetical protein [Gemmataceae bacterium]
MRPQFLERLYSLRALIPAVLLGALAFVLACQPLSDYDVWWHVRTGEWILAHHHVPDLDPFTFGSADQHWIDLHWLFQIGLALVFRAGGVPGTILLTAALAAIAVVIAVNNVRQPTSWTAVLLVWVPALVLAQSRFRPRPEMVTLLCLAAFLAVLSQVERRPRLSWLLPVIQLLWVNSHGLFVLGPIVLSFWLIDRLARRWTQAAAQPLDGLHREPPSRTSRPAVIRIGLASLGVVLACWCSPYGHKGAVFPFVLYPKVTEAGNPYKEYIDEFVSPQQFYLHPTQRLAQAPLLGCFHFLLLFLPVSFVLPPIWRSAGVAFKTLDNRVTAGSLAGMGVLIALVFLLVVNVLAVLMPHPPAALAGIGKAAPVLVLLTGVAGGLCLKSRSRMGACLSAVTGIALMAWMVWLADRLTNSTSPGRPMIVLVGLLALLAGASAAFLAWRLGMSLFGILLAGAFGYLAWQATNSLSRFGLVAGMLMAWNLGPWIAELVAGLGTPSWQRWLRWVPPTAASALLAAWGWAAGTDHYPRWLNQFPPP